MNISKDKIPPRFENHYDRAVYLLSEYKIGVYLASAALIVLFATGRLGIPELPTVVGWGLQWFAVGIIPAMWLGKTLVVDPWIPDPRYRVMEADVDRGIMVDAHFVPKSVWRERNTGEFPAIKPDEGFFDYIVTSYEWDPELQQLTVEGANEELADPTDMIATQGQINAIYGELMSRAEQLQRIEADERMRRFKIEENIVNDLIAAVETGLEITPGQTEQIVKDSGADGEVSADDRTRSARTDEYEDPPTLNDMIAANGGVVSSADIRQHRNGQQAATDGGKTE